MNLWNLKKRDKFWLKRWIFFIIVFLAFVTISFVNILLFNNSYMEEEREELNLFYRQVEWAVTPFLKEKDFEMVKKYCLDFDDDDYRFRIFDKNKNLIATSRANEIEPMLDSKSKILKKRKGLLKIYRHSIKNKMIGHLEQLTVNNEPYYIEVTISEEDVLKSIIKAQQSIFILLGIFLIFIFWSVYYILHKIRVPFDYLEDNITKIANGELDTPIDIQKHEILHELSLSIKKMANQLKHQIIRLKQLEEYKSEFIQNISHEIKTPITAINMAVELIENNKDKNANEQMEECLNIVTYQIGYINTLVNDILSLSELEEEKIKEKRNFNYFILNNTINNIVEYLPHQNITINLIQNDTVNLFGDEDLITKAISNLITNAVKYSNSDKIDITIKKNDKTCEIQIKDYGVGIPVEHQEKIFEKFYRVDKSRSRANGGTGLGLAIVKNIIELHNGTIILESDKDKGANFIISIPLV